MSVRSGQTVRPLAKVLVRLLQVQRRDVVDFDKADPGASDYPRTQMEQLVVYGNGNKVLVDGKPSTLAYSHMAMIELLPDGRLVAAWQVRGAK